MNPRTAPGKMIRANQRKAVNQLLAKLPTYFDGIPLEEIDSVLRKSDLILIQEDRTAWSGFFCGREGHTLISIGVLSTGEAFYGNMRYEEIENSALSISWYKMTSGRYEIVTYLS